MVALFYRSGDTLRGEGATKAQVSKLGDLVIVFFVTSSGVPGFVAPP
jgi:hypothetical protein